MKIYLHNKGLTFACQRKIKINLLSVEGGKKSVLRIGLNRLTVADACGRTQQAIGEYERGVSMPGGQALIGFSNLGADIQYILTSIRPEEKLVMAEAKPDCEKREEIETRGENRVDSGTVDPRERAVLDLYRGLSKDDRARIPRGY